jgi:hypothetical protein
MLFTSPACGISSSLLSGPRSLSQFFVPDFYFLQNVRLNPIVGRMGSMLTSFSVSVTVS